MQHPISEHNRHQKVFRLAREIAGFRTRLDQLGKPETPQQKRAATLASRCLVQRERALSAVLARPAA